MANNSAISRPNPRRLRKAAVGLATWRIVHFWMMGQWLCPLKINWSHHHFMSHQNHVKMCITVLLLDVFWCSICVIAWWILIAIIAIIESTLHLQNKEPCNVSFPHLPPCCTFHIFPPCLGSNDWNSGPDYGFWSRLGDIFGGQVSIRCQCVSFHLRSSESKLGWSV